MIILTMDKVSLGNIFPTLPPVEDLPQFQTAVEDNSNPDPDNAGFGWVIIVGPKAAVTSFGKRDGSHMELFDCPTSRDDNGLHTAKAVCMHDRDACFEIFEGGVEGTIVRMPDHVCFSDHFKIPDLIMLVYRRSICSCNCLAKSFRSEFAIPPRSKFRQI